jgi:hypothetical protein
MGTTFTPPGSLRTAVLFLVFNRPDTTSRVFEAIRRAKPPRLYVASDGPRLNHEGEQERVAQVRQIASSVDWPCEVKTLFRNENLGCKKAVSESITWFFEQEEQGIILEDDCLPSQSFFWFCELMLNKFKSNFVVMHIGGHKPKHVNHDDFSISFTRATHIWGWATWADRWKHYTADLSINEEELKILGKYEFFVNEKAAQARMKTLRGILRGEIDTWDYQWNFVVRASSGLAIRPSLNLVENIGHGHKDAVHTTSIQATHKASEIDLNNLKIPKWVLPNRNLENEFEKGIKMSLRRKLLRRLFK